MLKRKDQERSELSLSTFQEFNEEIFFDDTITEDENRAINDKSEQYISTEEVKHTIQHHFSANKSSGLSPIPL